MSFAAVAVGVGSAVAGAAVSSALAPSPGGGGSGAQQAAGAADPFASQRPQYQTMLSAMVTGKNADGSAYDFQSSDPSYQWRFDQGVKATNQGEAQKGLVNSGDRLMALQDYGQNQASTEYANQFSRLSQLAGGNIGSPAAAGQIIAGANAQQQAGASALGNQIGGAVGQGIGGLFGGTSGAPQSMGSDAYGVGSNQYGFQSGVSDPSYGVGSSYSFNGVGV